MTKIKASDLQRKLLDFARGAPSDIIIPNYFVGSYEMDLFKMSEKGFITEYEIKVSRKDLQDDFKKSHTHGWREDAVTTSKHNDLAAGRLKTNRFYFVTPFQMVLPETLPNHVGLIWLLEDRLQVAKNAPMLHKNVADPAIYKTLAVGLSYREQHLKNRYFYERSRITQLEAKLSNIEKYFNQLGGYDALEKLSTP